MGDTGKSNGEPGQAPDNGALRPRWLRKGQPGTARAGAKQNDSPALTELYHTHYRSLIRLAALLTGDAGTAEAVVVDSFVALHDARKTMRTCDEALPYLRRFVVARSRPAARHHRPASGDRSPVVARMPGYPDRHQQTPPFENSAVVQALAALPHPQREAVVLTLYLGLTEEQAAAAMRVGQNALRRHLAAGKTALRTVLPQGSTEPSGDSLPRGHPGPQRPRASRRPGPR